MAPDKSLAAEIEAVTERERTRLIAWLERYALSSGNRIDREITADALMADFLAPLIAEAETLRSDVSSLQNDCADEVAARRAESERHAAEIAALQSRAFEDGARKDLSDALAAYDAAERKRATDSAVYDEVSSRMGGYPDIREIMDRVGAEEACIRASLAADLARSKLIGAVRAALAEQEKGDA